MFFKLHYKLEIKEQSVTYKRRLGSDAAGGGVRGACGGCGLEVGGVGGR